MRAAVRRRGWAASRARTSPPLLECREVHLFSIALKIVVEHPAPVQSLPVLANYDVLQIAGSVQAGQGQDEMRFSYNQMQIDIIVAVQLLSAVQGDVFEGMALEPQLLEDPIRGDRLQVPSLPDRLGYSQLMIGNQGEGGDQEATGLLQNGDDGIVHMVGNGRVLLDGLLPIGDHPHAHLKAQGYAAEIMAQEEVPMIYQTPQAFSILFWILHHPGL